MPKAHIPAKPKNENELLEILANIIFVMGFKWSIVQERWPKIKNSFHDFDVKKIKNSKVEEYLGKPGMINNKRKIKAIIENARKCHDIVKQHGSLQNWVDIIVKASKESLLAKSLEEECECFNLIGKTTRRWVAYVLTEAGDKPCVKEIED